MGEKYEAEKERRTKNNQKNTGHFVLLQRLRAAHALRWDQHKRNHTRFHFSVLNCF
jgi:hypothetical protein